MGKWTATWRAALHESLSDRVLREAPRSAADVRDERVERAANRHGVIRSQSASWDGRVLRVTKGEIMPAGRTAARHKRRFWVPVEIPASSIVSVRSFMAELRVVTVDGREYRFVARKVIAEAIMAVIS